MWMETNFHMKRWAPGLALKKRPKVIQKWPISMKKKVLRDIKGVFHLLRKNNKTSGKFHTPNQKAGT